MDDGGADDTTRCDDREADDQRSWMTLRDRILPVTELARRAAFEMPPENFVIATSLFLPIAIGIHNWKIPFLKVVKIYKF